MLALSCLFLALRATGAGGEDAILSRFTFTPAIKLATALRCHKNPGTSQTRIEATNQQIPRISHLRPDPRDRPARFARPKTGDAFSLCINKTRFTPPKQEYAGNAIASWSDSMTKEWRRSTS